MPKILNSPLVRISFGLAMLTVSMLLVADFLGLIPDTKSAEIQSRKVIAESLAVQLSTQIADQQLHSVEEVLRSVVERNNNVRSAAVRAGTDGLLATFGDHNRYWTLAPGDKSTPTQINVPLFSSEGRWGTVELTFTALDGTANLLSGTGSFTTVILFMALAGFLAYLVFLKRTMRELDPDAVIPERVRTALDTLTEGLLIMDKAEYIVFSNAAFALKTGLTPKDLVGKNSADFDWEIRPGDSDCSDLPWVCVLQGKELPKGVSVRLRTELDEIYTFTVNASPISSTAREIRGVLITFDDITEIEAKNQELRRTLGKLEQSQLEVTRQNQELQVLATRDPLTDTLNRRSFFQGFDTLFAEARAEEEDLSCIMVDIDHFKSVNDRFGHAIGDKVIKMLAKFLTEHSRSYDLVGRIGGEEFCVVLPGLSLKIAARIAERMRVAVQEGEGGKFTHALRITASFGVSTLSEGAQSSQDLVYQADKALYAAKENGRNRVVAWSQMFIEKPTEVALHPPSDEQQKHAEPQSNRAEQTRSVAGDTRMALDIAHKYSDPDGVQDTSIMQDRTSGQTHPEKHQDRDLALFSGDSPHIPNRILLFDRIEQSIKRTQRQGTQIAVLVMDADALQLVNDTLGLETREKLAKAVVSRFKKTLRRTDTITLTEQDELLFSVSRLGSNEIVILLTDLKRSEILTAIIQRIFLSLKEAVEVAGHEVYLNANIGVSLFPHDGRDPETLLKNASSAMREAKRNPGRHNFRFYAEEINRRAEKQIRLEAELHRALERGELLVYYQPKVDLSTGKIMGMEALVRWHHPQLGVVSPNDFIPVAEHTGLIEEIGRWVIHAACRQIHFWQHAGYGTINVAVNLSPVEFRNSDLGDQILALLDEFSLPRGALEIEITETVVMQNMETAVVVLEKLSNAGVIISIDDFGTGYSSLSYLKRFPLSKVKIDRSFISDFMQGSNDAAIVSAIIAMSHSLGLRVVAEGVETEEQMRFLQDLHCDEMQGYLVSRPVPRENANDILARSSSIRRMILDYGVDSAGLMEQQGPGSTSEMLGILNDYPPPDVEPLTGQDSRALGN